MRFCSVVLQMTLVALVCLAVVGCPSSPLGGDLRVSHSSYDFGTAKSEFTFYIWTESAAGSAAFTVSSDQTWLKVSPSSGTAGSSESSAAVKASVDRSALDDGVYTGTVTVSSGGSSKKVAITARVGDPKIGLSATSYDFGSSQSTWAFEITNNGEPGSVLEFQVLAEPDWVSVSPSSGICNCGGDKKSVGVTIDREAMSKSYVYAGTITISAKGAPPRTIKIKAREPGPEIAVSKTTHDFGSSEEQWGFDIWNSGEAGSLLEFAVQADQDWVTVQPASGTSASASDRKTVTLTVDRDAIALDAKSSVHEANVTVSAHNLESKVVKLEVRVCIPEIGLTDEFLDFGGGNDEMTFAIFNEGDNGSQLDFEVTTEDDWISVQPSSGQSTCATDKSCVKVSVDRAAMKAAAAAAKAQTPPYRTTVGTGDDVINIAVVKGSAYQMGYDLARLMAAEVTANITNFEALIAAQGFTNAELDQAWASVSPYVEQRFKDEVRGFAAGLTKSGTPCTFQDVIRIHMQPVLDSFACSAVAAWDTATRDGHLYQIRNLDWTLGTGAEDYPLIAVYLPDNGIPHANIGFAGLLSCIAGMNRSGIALSEIGNSPGSEMPYDIDGEHFGTMFRKILHNADNLTEAYSILETMPRIKKYHYMFGDGRNELKAYKIKAHAPELLRWADNDPTDELLTDPEFAGMGLGVYADVVNAAHYEDIADKHIKANCGTYDAEKMIELSRAVAMKNHSVLNIVYDATALQMWVAYAELGSTAAYQREYVHVDLYDYFESEAGCQEGLLTVNAARAESKTVKVMAGSPQARIGVDAAAHVFDKDEDTWAFNVWNSGDTDSVLDFSVSSDRTWLVVSPGSGSSDGALDKVPVQVTVNRALMPKSTVERGTLKISSNGDIQEIAVSVLIPGPEFEFEPLLDFGEDDLQLNLDVSNIGDAGSVLDFQVESDKTWISVSPASGSSVDADDAKTIVVSINRNAFGGAGVYSGRLYFTAPGATPKSCVVKAAMLAPIADFKADNTTPDPPGIVSFEDASDAGSGQIVEYIWDFGDGSPLSTLQNPVHHYDVYGVFTVTLKVRSEYRLQGTVTKTNYIVVAPKQPSIAFSVSDTRPYRFETLNFTDLSDPGSGTIASWEWDFGDEQKSFARNPSHVYDKEGVYEVKLKITVAPWNVKLETAPRVIEVRKVNVQAGFDIDKRVIYSGLDKVTLTDTSIVDDSETVQVGEWRVWFSGPGPGGHPGSPEDLTRRDDPVRIKYDSTLGRYVADPDDGLAWYPGVGYLFHDRGLYNIEHTFYVSNLIDPGDPDAWDNLPKYDWGKVLMQNAVEVRFPSSLDWYARGDEGVFAQSKVRTISGNGYIAYVLGMTSQEWRLRSGALASSQPVWEHDLIVIVPSNHKSWQTTALLYVTGGNRGDASPTRVSPELARMAVESGSIVAVLNKVPNQPSQLTGSGVPLSDDALMAESFRRTLDTGDDYYPLLHPMVRSTIRAMDAVERFVAGDVPDGLFPEKSVSQFVLAGAGNQAWACYMTAAHDRRVRGLIPMAFDFLNIWEQRQLQLMTYGGFPDAWDGYIRGGVNVLDQLWNPYALNVDTLKQYRRLLERYMRDILYDTCLYPGYEDGAYRSLGKMAELMYNDDPYDWNLMRDLPGYVTPGLYAMVYNAKEYLNKESDYWKVDGRVFKPNKDEKYTERFEFYKAVGYSDELYGGILGAIRDEMLDAETERCDAMRHSWLQYLIDPYFYGSRYDAILQWHSEYGGRLNIPKYIINASGDEYTPPNASRMYFSDLDDPKCLRYVPNVGHDLGGYDAMLLSALPWYINVASGGSATVPYSWRTLEENTLDVSVLDADSLASIRLWVATDDVGDFRKAPGSGVIGPTWTSRPLSPYMQNRYLVEVAYDETKYKAFFVEVVFNSAYGGTEVYTTQVTVLPPRYLNAIAPEAKFTADAIRVTAGDVVTFTDESTPGTASIVDWQWEFGDAGTSKDQHPSHTYTKAGTYTVSLKVVTAHGTHILEKERYIDVEPVP